MTHNPNNSPKNEFNVLMDLGFQMEVPEGDSINYADRTAKEEVEDEDFKPAEEILTDESDVPLRPVNHNDPTEPVPGESEWSQRNRLPVEEQQEEAMPTEDLFSLLHDRLLYHPLANQMMLDRYVRRLKLITF